MIAHAAITAALTVGLHALGLPPIVLAGLVPVGLYIGREHAQAEERIIDLIYKVRAAMPWWGGFRPAAWNGKSLADVLAPVAVATAVAVLFLTGGHHG